MAELTIEDLAQRSGFTTRSIRDLQAHGMLPPPEKRGRLGYYGDEHLNRLRLIDRLQSEGFSRAAISALLRAWDEGRTLGDVLGFEEEITGFLQPVPRPRLSRETVARLFDGDDDLIDAVVELGLLEPGDDDFEVVNPTLFDVGGELIRAGIPLEVVLDQSRYLRYHCDDIANRFVHMFMTMVWQPFVERGAPEEEIGEVTDTLRRFRPLITHSVQAAMDESMNRAVTHVLHQLIATGIPRDADLDDGLEPIAEVIDLA